MSWRRVPPLCVGTIVPVLLIAIACTPAPEWATTRIERTTVRHAVSAEGVLTSSRVTTITVPPRVRGSVRLAWLAPEGARVEAGQVVARFDDSDLRSELDAGDAEFRSTGFEIDKRVAEHATTTSEIQADFEVASLELAMADRYQLTDNDVFSRREIIESRIDGELATARRDHAAFSADSVTVSGKAALDILDIKQRQTQQRVDRAQEGLSSLEVTAPHAGLFLRARDWQQEPIDVGAELFRGAEVGELPDTGALEVEAFVLEADAGGLAVGKAASVVVEAHPEEVLAATISRVDGLARRRFRGSPVQYFGVTLTLDTPAAAALKPGQRVQARLHLGTWEDVVAIPRQAVVADADGYHVYRVEGGVLAPVDVVLGEAATGLVIVESGLDEGDRIALDPPARGGPGSSDGDEDAAADATPAETGAR